MFIWTSLVLAADACQKSRRTSWSFCGSGVLFRLPPNSKNLRSIDALYFNPSGSEADISQLEMLLSTAGTCSATPDSRMAFVEKRMEGCAVFGSGKTRASSQHTFLCLHDRLQSLSEPPRPFSATHETLPDSSWNPKSKGPKSKDPTNHHFWNPPNMRPLNQTVGSSCLCYYYTILYPTILL